LLDFSNYSYSHLKYLVNPSCRDSVSGDSLSELELTICNEWSFNFVECFARAFDKGGNVSFYYINKNVVDECHLKLESLVKIYNGKKKSLCENSTLIKADYS